MIKLKKEELLRFNQKEIIEKNVLVRVDFNVDIINGKIFDIYRLKSFKNTLNFLKKAKRVILISHFNDPKKKDKKYSFKNLIPQIEKILKIKIGFLENLNQKPKEKINLFENIRFWPEEKSLDFNFAKKLSSYGDIFINDAFSVSHRKQSSVILIPKFLKTFYGLLFEKEINLLNKVLKRKKITLILGGAKISTKLPLIEKFINKDCLIILTGGLANTFLKAKGFEIGNSLIEKDILKEIKKIISPKILTPFDFILQNRENKFLGEIKENDIIYDVGQESLKIFFEEIKKAKTIVWNGPLGFIEDNNFEKGTFELVKFLIKLKNKFIIIGGGDTLAFLERKKLLKKFKNISTGGGAMLEYLAKETLPVFEK